MQDTDGLYILTSLEPSKKSCDLIYCQDSLDKTFFGQSLSDRRIGFVMVDEYDAAKLLHSNQAEGFGCYLEGNDDATNRYRAAVADANYRGLVNQFGLIRLGMDAHMIPSRVVEQLLEGKQVVLNSYGHSREHATA